MRTLGIILVIIAMALLGWKIHNDWHDCCCDKKATSEAVAPVKNDIVRDSGPLLYNWSNGDPIYGNGWASYRDSISSNIKDNQNLQITGYYRADEDNSTSFTTLGLARADSLRNVFAANIPADRIVLRDREVSAKDGDKDYPFISADFRYLINSKNIKETDDGTLIYFPFNSTNKLNDSEVEAYLNDVADRVKSSGERVRLTGHTDAAGGAAANLALGQSRADIIKNYLQSRGVASNKIITLSKGESQPIADNNSSAGMAKNRRTELQIIK